MTKQYTKEFIQSGIDQSPLSMRGAALALNIPYGTFILYAQRFGLYQPNRSGKGLSKRGDQHQESLWSILDGSKPSRASSSQLKARLYKYGIKEEKCECCGQGPEWAGKTLVLHLDHIDGDHYNNKLENLRILCPNCHSQTATYCNSSKANNKHKRITDCSHDELKAACEQSHTVTEAARALGLNPRSVNVRIKLQQFPMCSVPKPKPKPTPKPKAKPKQSSTPKNQSSHLPPFTADELQELLRYHPLSGIGPMFSLTGGAIKRWVTKWNLIQPPMGYFYRAGVREKVDSGYIVKIPFTI